MNEGNCKKGNVFVGLQAKDKAKYIEDLCNPSVKSEKKFGFNRTTAKSKKSKQLKLF